MAKLVVSELFDEYAQAHTRSRAYWGTVYADAMQTWGPIGLGSVIEWDNEGQPCECCGTMIYVTTIITDGHPVKRWWCEKEPTADADDIVLTIHHGQRCQAKREAPPAAAGGVSDPAGGAVGGRWRS